MEVTKHELPIVLLFASLAGAQEPKSTLSCVQCRTLAESYLNEAPDLTRHLTVKELPPRNVVIEQWCFSFETARNDKDLLPYGRAALNAKRQGN